MDEQLGEERRVKNGMEGVVYGHMRMGMHLPTGTDVYRAIALCWRPVRPFASLLLRLSTDGVGQPLQTLEESFTGRCTTWVHIPKSIPHAV